MSVFAASMPTGMSSVTAAITAPAIHAVTRADPARPEPVAASITSTTLVPMPPCRDGGDMPLLVDRRQLQRVEAEFVLPPAIDRQHFIRIDVAGDVHQLQLAAGPIDDRAPLEREQVLLERRDRRRRILGLRVNRHVAEFVVGE